MNWWYIGLGVLFTVLGYLIWRMRPRIDALRIAEAEYREWRKGEAAEALRKTLERET
jgi:hypothetical protein